MSKLNMAVGVWLAINLAIPIIVLLRHRRIHQVRRMYHWVVETTSEARQPYAHALVAASHHRR